MDYQNLYTGKVSVYKRLIRNKITLISLIVIGSAVIAGILGYSITPDSTPHANEQFIELSTKNPGFKVTMLLVRKNENIPRQHLVRRILFGEKSMFTSIPISSFYLIMSRLL